ncbi:ABC transporter permease [Bradyrhizobium tropiciagri]|uniref:ABC transporter permease n=1 Tax=Bradyrhizobium tropiciagri TaxID=312253 RepID=UPI001BABB7DD|nr:ABC transporter permease [Bradyrhizobium tropiciagri]
MALSVKTATTIASPAVRIWRNASRSAAFRIGLVVLILLLAVAAFWPLLSGLDPAQISVSDKFKPPIFVQGGVWAHPLGTDQLGRDVLVRCLVGLRYSLIIGGGSVILMFIIGCGIGLISGFWAGRIDGIIMRITDAQLSIPVIILAISILGVSRPTLGSIILVLSIAGWPLYARVARAAALSERRREYVRGARILGASNLRILLLMVAPNILPPIAFVAVLDVARMMIFEGILGFLGLGVQPPTPTFGNIISDGRKYIISAWWIATAPGVLLGIALMGINLIGVSLERARNSVYGGDQ